MKLIANTSRIFEMGVSSEIPTGNLVWVDRVNGNDLFALRGRMDRPFLTLSKAKSAASIGDTIIVGPGTYNDTDLASEPTTVSLTMPMGKSRLEATPSPSGYGILYPGSLTESKAAVTGPIALIMQGRAKIDNNVDYVSNGRAGEL